MFAAILSRVTFNIVVLKSTSCNRCSTSRDIMTQVELPTSFCWRERDISAGGQPEVVVSLKKLPYCRKAFNDQQISGRSCVERCGGVLTQN